MPLTLKYALETDELSRFLELACLTYGGDREERRIEAKKLLELNPSLSETDLYSMCCTGNMDSLSKFLLTDEVDVNEPGGPMSWPPLLYCCYSRVESPGGSTLAAAELLLEHGADPNAHFMWGSQYRFTALTGAFGEGESGPLQQPPHRKCEQLARALLEAGADPNDSQALYNRMFTDGSECVALLIEFGLNVSARNNWLEKKAGRLIASTTGTLAYQLRYAIEKHHDDRVAIILDAVPGERINELDADCENGSKVTSGSSFLKLAMLSGNQAAVAGLVERGAGEPELTPVERFVSAVNNAQGDIARQIMAQHDELSAIFRKRLAQLFLDAAGADRTQVLQCALELGVNVNVMLNATALHTAAWGGNEEAVKVLVDAGANLELKDPNHQATPEDWANYSGNTRVAEFLKAKRSV